MIRFLQRVALLLLMPAPLFAQESPPQILQIVQERLRPRAERSYQQIEDDNARTCAELKCPNPYLALESLAGPKEIWWLNTFASDDDRSRVGREYEQNSAVMTALLQSNQRKRPLTYGFIDIVATHRPNPNDGCVWTLERIRFVVITVTRGEGAAKGCVFDAADGSRFVVAMAKTRPDANRKAAGAGGDAKIFAIKPSWSLPADAWIDADPGFWRGSPAFKRRQPSTLQR